MPASVSRIMTCLKTQGFVLVMLLSLQIIELSSVYQSSASLTYGH